MKAGSGKWRFQLVLVVAGLGAAVLLARYAFIMLGGSDPNAADGIPMPAVERGPLLDRGGRILAIQTRLNSVSAWIPYVSDPEETSRLLAEALSLDRDRVLERFKTNSGFVFIKRKISPTESSRVQALLEEGRLEGISLYPEFGRSYPGRTLASHLVGYVGTDNIGLDGLEYTFNQELSPPVVGENLEMVLGNQIFLTIDLSIQHTIETIAEETLAANKASSIMILVMEAKTGEMLGYASLPNYDPNSFATLSPETMKNKPISLLYEPGSVFKVFSVASFMELAGIGPEDTFYCNGAYETAYGDGKSIRIGCLGRHGYVDAEKILSLSCNAGAAYASERVSAVGFHHMLRQFGFGEVTGVPLNGEEKGSLRPPESWSVRSKPTIAIGQEISVTAMQIMKAATALANDGVLLEPLVVKKIVSPSGRTIKEYSRRPVKQLLSPETAGSILRYMERVTQPGGTALRAAIRGLRVSAKTGTAQMIDPRTGTYSDTAFVASCLALFPTQDPQVIVYVVIESPQGDSYYGGRVAAPVVARVGDFLAPYLGIPRDGERVVTHPGRITLPRVGPPEMKDRVPDFSGFSKRALIPLLAREDITVIIEGSGWVYRQSPPPGSPVTPGMTLTLELR